MGTRLAEDRAARALFLRGLRKVLVALREQAKRHPSLPDPPAGVPAVSWNEPAAVAPEQSVLEAALAFHAGDAIVLPEGATAEPTGPTPALIQLLHRLVDVLALSDLEREFFAAGASRGVPDAWDGLAAYADWLEERGNDAGAARVRKLTPRPGDLLLFTTAPGGPDVEATIGVARRLNELVTSRGVETTWMVLPPGVSLGGLSEAEMARLGWVRAGRLAQVRERCAALAEQHHYYRLAADLRADLSLAEMDAAGAPAGGGKPA